MTAEIVTLRENTLRDIPAQLRAMADRIEKGEYGEVDGLFVVMPRGGDYPKMWGWGDTAEPNDMLVQLQLALHWHCQAMVGRI